jgi:deoxyribodipyrimidine photolyase-related protein
MNKARLILGDQLNYQHSWFDDEEPDTFYIMMEIRQETDYVNHHIQKIVAFFSAMRSFCEHLEKLGKNVIYIELDATENKQSLTDNLTAVFEKHSIEKFEYQLPDEYRLDEQLSEFCSSLSIGWECFDTEHFLTERADVSEMFRNKKTFLMETFYRKMRKKYDILMDGDQPETGQWNYDSDNRKKLPKSPEIPDRKFREKDVSELVSMIKNHNGLDYIGKIDEKKFIWPSSRREALADLRKFCDEYLQNFGTYQDAMHSEYDFNYHSLLSFALNSKMLHPLEVVNAVLEKWRNEKEEISISQVEGFIRQIIGWREFMRGIYWTKMPEYKNLNFFNHKRKLPDWFWNGNTKMNCLKHAVQQSLDHSYAHHIQRLMVTGNFMLLAGINPDEVDQWYLGIYIDAIEWVEITNTRGMSQFADGGIVGTKPYVSSSNYIKKMSNYCDSCQYSQTKKTGENACPFNSLYWHFYDRHRDKLENNPRIGMMYRTFDKMDPSKREETIKQGDYYLENIETL